MAKGLTCGAASTALAAVQQTFDSVRVKRWIEIDKIDARVGKFFPVGKPFEVVAEIQPIHSGKTEHNNIPPALTKRLRRGRRLRPK